jgi:hypothetical protein
MNSRIPLDRGASASTRLWGFRVGEVRGHPWLQIHSQLRSQFRSQLTSQLYSQLHAQLYYQLRSQLYDHLHSQIRVAVK